MELRVLGCHGGETPRHRTTAFLVDDRLAIDAGCLTSRLELEDQARLKAVVVSHAHLDHIRDLATIADNRCQLESGSLIVAATRATIEHLRAHFFNDKLWPDFTLIPAGDGPTIVFQEISLETPTSVIGYRVTAVPVSHTVDTAGFVIDDGKTALGFSGDTGPTDRFWQMLNAEPHLKALLMEVSFPNRAQGLAEISGHHTPATLEADLRKYRAPESLPTLLYHIKPPFQAEVEKECARIKGLNIQVLDLKDQFIL
ncbi:MAG: 3',5'-cyclic-nucleotide phosphodiesterase [Myxococcales bacterium]|nr:3',5'-cyclic-nucleotide phosphodiesterase [Myxococcales bacterium]